MTFVNPFDPKRKQELQTLAHDIEEEITRTDALHDLVEVADLEITCVRLRMLQPPVQTRLVSSRADWEGLKGDLRGRWPERF